jgi:hypothetical protein
MMPFPYAVFFYGGPLFVAILIAFMLGAVFEHRRSRVHLTKEELRHAEMSGYHLGLKHGYYKAVRERKRHPVLFDVDREG